MLDHMLNGEREESVVVNGISILQTLLECRKIRYRMSFCSITNLRCEHLVQVLFVLVADVNGSFLLEVLTYSTITDVYPNDSLFV